MSRTVERMLKKALTTATALMCLSAIALLAVAIYGPQDEPDLANIELSAAPAVEDAAPSADPKITRLAATRMTRTIIARPETFMKPPAPDLATLIRVKGILAFGKPKDNEALIEIIRINQTRSYKVGETIQEVSASVVKIEKGVTFQYEGRQVTLEIKSGDRAEYAPIATPGEKSSTASK